MIPENAEDEDNGTVRYRFSAFKPGKATLTFVYG
jgi:hypothetical protein